ncbi:MAG TPA: C1 family peptidase [Bacteroidia bacterium]|nr:C1 family peptidase [Bacteroidia bacterium]
MKKYRLNIVPSRKQEEDWTLEKAARLGHFRPVKIVPGSVDLRESWWKPGNQGQTGSCVGWSLADGVLRWHYVKKKKMRHDEKPSVRFIWMSAKEMDEYSDRPTTFIDDSGTSLKTALDVARKFGCVKDSLLPFGRHELYAGDEDKIFKIASKYKIRSYYNLVKSAGSKDKLNLFRRWLASGGGPIFTCLDVDIHWENALLTKGHLRKYNKRTANGGHAVCIVGYTPDYFIVRNSWGASGWGDKGFAYAHNAYAQQAFKEAYGVVI